MNPLEERFLCGHFFPISHLSHMFISYPQKKAMQHFDDSIGILYNAGAFCCHISYRTGCLILNCFFERNLWEGKRKIVIPLLHNVSYKEMA